MTIKTQVLNLEILEYNAFSFEKVKEILDRNSDFERLSIKLLDIYLLDWLDVAFDNLKSFREDVIKLWNNNSDWVDFFVKDRAVTINHVLALIIRDYMLNGVD